MVHTNRIDNEKNNYTPPFTLFYLKAQYVLSERLQSEINKSKKINHSFPIRIEMIDKIDALELHQNFKANKIPIKDRAHITVQKN